MKNSILLLSILFFHVSSAHAADKCSLGLAKKIAQAAIEVEVQENNFKPGRLLFKRSDSQEYTAEYLKEQIRLIGDNYASKKYVEMKKDLEAKPDLHIYYIAHEWKANDGLDNGFYYLVRLVDYSRGCALSSIVTN